MLMMLASFRTCLLCEFEEKGRLRWGRVKEAGELVFLK